MDDERSDRDGGSLMARPQYNSFDELPNHIKLWLRNATALAGEDLVAFASKSIPALNGKSILEVAAQAEGDKLIADFCGRLSKLC